MRSSFKLSRIGMLVIEMALGGELARASVSNVYIAQTAAGSANGSSCANASAYTFFNAAGSWGSGATQIGPGTTVHVCGTISNQLVFKGSGTSGSVITLLFESGAVLNATGSVWNANSPIWAVNVSYILINGGVSNTGGATPNIMATQNGSGLTYQLPVTGIAIGGSHDIEIKNFGCANLYVHTSLSDSALTPDTAACVSANPQGANISIHDSTFHDSEDGILFSVAGAGNMNMQVYNMNMYNIDHFLFTTCDPSTASGFYYHDNQIHDPSNWDTTANTYHHDGWLVNANTGQTCTGLYDYNNLYSGNWGANNTSPIFFDNNGGVIESAYVFNDVFLNKSSSVWGNGINIVNGPGPSNGPAHVWNNTVMCPASSPSSSGIQLGGANMDFRNNVQSGCGVFFSTSNATNSSIAAMDYNYYANYVASGDPGFAFNSSHTTSGQTLAQQFIAWRGIVQSLTSGSESHSAASSSAGLNASGTPQSGAATIGTGVNLCAGIISCTGGLAALASTTSAGNTVTPSSRPPTGSWDIGAYEFAGSGGSTQLSPPSAVDVISQ